MVASHSTLVGRNLHLLITVGTRIRYCLLLDTICASDSARCTAVGILRVWEERGWDIGFARHGCWMLLA